MSTARMTGHWVAVWALVCFAANAMGTTTPNYTDFSRYRVILDKKLFGEPPKAPTPAATPPTPVKQGPSFVKELRMVAVIDSRAGIRVGFENIKTKKSYLLNVGDEQDGYLLLEADYERECAKLRKDGKEDWISMSGDPVPDTGGASQTAAVSPTPAGSNQPMSYIERLRQRKAAIRRKTVAPPALTGKELEDHLRKVNMDLIRKGDPPLPIRLTPEEDAKLVEEGVLPPLPAE